MENLVQALKQGQIEEIKALVQAQPDLLEQKTEQGISLITLAAYHQKKDLVQFLANLKSELSLYEAIIVGQTESVKLWINQNTDLINAYSADGFSPLGLACFFNQMSIVQWLIDKGAKVNQASNNTMKVAPIHSAVAIQNVAMVALLLENGANVNIQQTQGVTALHSAAHRGQVPMVKLLLKHGADKTLKMGDGKTPLDFAIAAGHREVVKLLKGN